MTFSIIGTGNIAWFFGSRLVSGRHHCKGIYARDAAKAEQLAEALLADKSGTIGDIEDGAADICFLAVSDTAISSVSAMLRFSQTVLVHTAGAMDIDSIQAANHRAVLWPVYSILKNSLPDHREIPCAWEASTDRAKTYLMETAHAITDVLIEAKYEQRKWLHLGAVISNNFVNHLLAIGEQVCSENNLPFSALRPIIEQTFERIKHSSPKQLQTGPAIRNDMVTITQQLAVLKEHPLWQKVYQAITESIQNHELGK